MRTQNELLVVLCRWWEPAPCAKGVTPMSHGSELKSPGAQALRAAGFKPCPRWWLTQDQMELLEYMAKQNEAEVNRIRSEANQKRG